MTTNKRTCTVLIALCATLLLAVNSTTPEDEVLQEFVEIDNLFQKDAPLHTHQKVPRGTFFAAFEDLRHDFLVQDLKSAPRVFPLTGAEEDQVKFDMETFGRPKGLSALEDALLPPRQAEKVAPQAVQPVAAVAAEQPVSSKAPVQVSIKSLASAPANAKPHKEMHKEMKWNALEDALLLPRQAEKVAPQAVQPVAAEQPVSSKAPVQVSIKSLASAPANAKAHKEMKLKEPKASDTSTKAQKLAAASKKTNMGLTKVYQKVYPYMII